MICGKMFVGTDEKKHFCDREEGHLKTPEQNLHYCSPCKISEKPKPFEQGPQAKQA